MMLLVSACAHVAVAPSTGAAANGNLLWDFTAFYDPSSVSHFTSNLSDHDRVAIIQIIKRFTGSRDEVRISSSIEGSFTSPNVKQTLVYASQYDDRRSMADGLWSFFVLFTGGHAQVINGGTGGVRGQDFLLRSVRVPSTGLDDVLAYSAWFGMGEDIGSSWLMSLVGDQPRIVEKLGTVYESTCDVGFREKASIASKLFLEDPANMAIRRKHYIRRCGDSSFRFLTSSQEDETDILLSLGRKRPNP